jgi:hypothetical protein
MLGVSGRAVARNELLDEGYDAFAPAPERKKLVGRFVAGVSGAFRWGTLAFTVVQETREYDTQRTPHRFGSIVVHVPF